MNTVLSACRRTADLAALAEGGEVDVVVIGGGRTGRSQRNAQGKRRHQPQNRGTTRGDSGDTIPEKAINHDIFPRSAAVAATRPHAISPPAPVRHDTAGICKTGASHPSPVSISPTRRLLVSHLCR